MRSLEIIIIFYLDSIMTQSREKQEVSHCYIVQVVSSPQFCYYQALPGCLFQTGGLHHRLRNLCQVFAVVHLFPDQVRLYCVHYVSEDQGTASDRMILFGGAPCWQYVAHPLACISMSFCACTYGVGCGSF